MTEEERILQNTGLVYHVAKSFLPTYGSQEKEDLWQTGMIGLIKAARTFRPETGYQFATYAARVIRNEILLDLRRRNKQPETYSLDAELQMDGLEHVTLLEMLQSDQDVEEEAVQRTEYDRIPEMLSSLPERERDILARYYGLCGTPIGDKMIAERYGVSQSYVNRIRRQALSKVRRKWMHDEL